MDWNLLRSMPTSHDVPAGLCLCRSRSCIPRVATTKSGDPTALIRKFGAWATRNVSRLWFGRTKEDLINLQWKSGGRGLTMRDTVHHWRTRQLRKFATQSSYDWRVFLTSIQGGDVDKLCESVIVLGIGHHISGHFVRGVAKSNFARCRHFVAG